MTLPDWYKKGITRVSEIVSFVHPFEWTDWHRLYLLWLYEKIKDLIEYNKERDIKDFEEFKKLFPSLENKEEIFECNFHYMEAASTMWTYVHEALEYFILKGKKKKIKKEFEDCREEIDIGVERLKKLKPDKIETEKYVIDKLDRFQWAVDLLYQKDWKWVLADWKTYWICKKRFWLDNKAKVPTSKRKKVELQMSIYCYALRQEWINIDKIELLFLHKNWIKVIEFTPFPDNQIEEILKQYKTHQEKKFWEKYTF